jgi:hypothetical protein
MWATKDMPMIHPKMKGACVMFSDFIDQHWGFLRLSEYEHTAIAANIPNSPETACILFEYGAEKGGYWTGEKFIDNVKDAVSITEHIYLLLSHTIAWLFYQSSCHKAFAESM